MRHRSLKKQRAKNYDGSDDDWSSLVSSVLDPATKVLEHGRQTANLEVTCSISGKEPNRILSMTFNNKVEDITQRLGAIDLQETEDTDDVDLFGWTSQVVEERDSAQGELAVIRAQIKTKDDTVSSLQKQLDELVEAKAELEKQMLSKFALLLNEKKLKIRMMHRVLATAKADPHKLKDMEALVGNDPATVAMRNKRSADNEGRDDDQDDSEGFETMEVDPAADDKKEPDSPASNNTTPTASEASDEEDEEISGPVRLSSPPSRTVRSVTTQNKSSEKSNDQKAESSRLSVPVVDDEETASDESEEL